MAPTLRSLLESPDPLCEEAINLLLHHKEEDFFVDYKSSFNPSSEKEWLGLTIDALAFANTMGGYIVFGVTDETFSFVGLEEEALKALTNISMVLQKLNRYIGPPFTGIRAKRFSVADLTFAAWYIPESKGRTHIVIKEGKVRNNGSGFKTILSPGSIYRRRSGTNQIIEPEDLEFIIGRRIDYFRDSLLSKIAKIVNSPPEHEILVFDPTSYNKNSRTFTISDSPDAIPVKGMSFTVTPSTDVEELSSWIAIQGRDELFQPRQERLWNIYANRSSISIPEKQTKHLVRFSLTAQLPSFYWIQTFLADAIFEILVRAVEVSPSISATANILNVSAFLGRSYHRKLLSKIDTTKLNPRIRKYPEDAYGLFSCNLLMSSGNREKKKSGESKVRLELEGEVTGIAKKASEGVIDYYARHRAAMIDCFLYAKQNGYKGPSAISNP